MLYFNNQIGKSKFNSNKNEWSLEGLPIQFGEWLQKEGVEVLVTCPAVIDIIAYTYFSSFWGNSSIFIKEYAKPSQ